MNHCVAIHYSNTSNRTKIIEERYLVEAGTGYVIFKREIPEKPIHTFYTIDDALAHFEEAREVANNGMWYIFEWADGARVCKTIEEIDDSGNAKEFMEQYWKSNIPND